MTVRIVVEISKLLPNFDVKQLPQLVHDLIVDDFAEDSISISDPIVVEE